MISHPLAKAYLVAIFACVVAACGTASNGADEIAAAFQKRSTNIQVTGEGVVDRVLSDDREGSPHQRFVVRTGTGQTVLMQHNIDVAPRIDGLKTGDLVSFSGEYVWNDRGGIIHWTHRDPAGRHAGGWVKHNGRMYE
jgi:hypothetical protein